MELKGGLGKSSSLVLISKLCMCRLENRKGLCLRAAIAQLSHSKARTLLPVSGNQLLPSLETIITIIQWSGLCCVTDVSAVFIRGWNCVSGKPWNNHIAEQENCLLPPPLPASHKSLCTMKIVSICPSLHQTQTTVKTATVFADLLWKKCLP